MKTLTELEECTNAGVKFALAIDLDVGDDGVDSWLLLLRELQMKELEVHLNAHRSKTVMTWKGLLE